MRNGGGTGGWRAGRCADIRVIRLKRVEGSVRRMGESLRCCRPLFVVVLLLFSFSVFPIRLVIVIPFVIILVLKRGMEGGWRAGRCADGWGGRG